MGEHPGKVIKNIATIMYTITAGILFLLWAGVSMSEEGVQVNTLLRALLGIPLSLIASYVVWLPIYAIGHLLCKVDEMAESLQNIECNPNEVYIMDDGAIKQIRLDIKSIVDADKKEE